MLRPLLIVAFWCLLISVTSAEEVRKWTARSGGFTVEAELVDVTGGMVVLKKADGSTINVPIDKLSLADVRYITSVMEAAQKALNAASAPGKTMPPKASDSNASARPNGSSAKAATPMPPKEQASDPDPTVEPNSDAKDASAPKAIPLTESGSSSWQVQFDRGPREFKIPAKLSIPMASDAIGLEIIYPEVQSSVVGFISSGLRSSIETWDLKTGRRIGSAMFEPGKTYMQKSLSPDGKTLAATSLAMGTVEIRSLQGNANAKPNEIKFADSTGQAGFIIHTSNDTLLILEASAQRIGCWNVKNKKMLAAIPSSNNYDSRHVALSAGGIYLALAGNIQEPISIYDTRNGALAGRLEFPKSTDASYGTVESLCFSADGTELSALCDKGLKSSVHVWSLKDGQHLSMTQLNKNSNSLIDGGYSSRGKLLEYLPEQKGWMVYGTGVLDRSLGGPVWVDPLSKVHPFNSMARRTLSDGRVVAARGSGRTIALTVEALPWKDIEKGTKVVSSGGQAEDAGMPPIQAAKNDGSVNALAAPGQWNVTEPALVRKQLTDKPIGTSQYPFTLQSMQFTSGDPSVGNLIALDGSNEIRTDGLTSKQLLQFDLQTGKFLGRSKVDTVGNYTDVSDSGNFVSVVTGKNRDRIDIYEVDGGQHVCGFRPINNATEGGQMIRLARFIDDQHILVIQSQGHVSLWELPSCKAIANLKYSPALPVNFVSESHWLTRSRKYLIVADQEGVFVVDTSNLSVAGMLQPVTMMRAKWFMMDVAVSQSGERLAGELSSGEPSPTLVVWDFKTGKVLAEHTLSIGGSQLDWADDKRVLVHGFRTQKGSDEPRLLDKDQKRIVDVVDVERGQMVWRYVIPGGKVFGVGSDGRLWFAAATSTVGYASICSATLPTQPALSVIDKLKGPQQLLGVGGSVALDVQLKPLGESVGLDLLIDRVRQSVTRQLETRQLRVDPRSSLALAIKVVETRTGNGATFQSSNGFAPRVQETRVECELTLKDITGNALWQRRQFFYNDPDRMVETLLPGESLEGRLRARQWDEVLRWFESEVLPEKVYEPIAPDGLGESMLGPQGEANVKLFKS